MTLKNTKDGVSKEPPDPLDAQRKSSGQNAKTPAKSDRRERSEITQKHNEISGWLLYGPDEDDISPCWESLPKSGTQKRNILYHIFGDLKEYKGKNQAFPDQVPRFLEYLTLRYPQLLGEEETHGLIPLLDVAGFSFEIFFRLIDLVIDQTVLERIKIKCDGTEQHCPLQKVHKGRRKQCLKDAVPDQDPKFEHFTTPEPVEPDNTSCIHDLIDVDKLEEEDERLRKVLRSVLEKGQGIKPCLQSILVDSNFDTGERIPGKSIKKIPVHCFKRFLQLHDPEVFVTEMSGGYTPLHLAVLLFERDAIDYQHLFSILEALVLHCPSSIFLEVGQKAEERGKMAYRMLMEQQRPEKKSTAELISREAAEKLLKETCIGSEEAWDVKKKFLYWDAKSAKQFYLNLSNESTLLDKHYIEVMRERSGIRFETALDSLDLPYWNPEDLGIRDHDRGDGRGSRPESNKTETSDPYIHIFKWLWETDVTKIFKLEVNDIGPDPHTNAAIRECLRGDSDMTRYASVRPSGNDMGKKNRPIKLSSNVAKETPSRNFEVEVWKWKKLDICSRTILYAAPNVRRLHLYSSGNTAVLHGWACQPGLSQLEHLEKLTIEIHPKNAKDKKDCVDYVVELKEGLAKQCPRLSQEDIIVEFHEEKTPSGNSVAASNVNQSNSDPTPHNYQPNPEEWIKLLKPFKEFMGNLNLDKPPIKIAVLDDGARLTNLQPGKQIGETFRPDNIQYFVGPCSHGTEMVRCIRAVCPMAEIYIARLDDSQSIENQKFTTTSACSALEWALSMDVDVISMSWTFKMRAEGERGDDENKFMELVQKGLKESILFGSLPDKGPIEDADKYAPIGIPGVIKIGSANALGVNSAFNRFERDFFTLPGEDLHTLKSETALLLRDEGVSGLGREHSSSPEDKQSGSSFATAYAAGLAGLILYCFKAHVKFENEPYNEDREKRLNRAKTVDGMKSIFRALAGREECFLRPYRILEGCSDDDLGVKRNAMDRIVTQLLTLN